MLRMGVPVATPISASDCAAAIGALIDRPGHRAKFEKEVRELFGTGLVRSTNSGRAALFVTLKAMKQSSGRDEVVVPACACPSIGRAVVKAGLKPILCDVGHSGSGLHALSLERALNGRTLAVVVAHLYGYPCDIAPVMELSHGAGAMVIEDAAQAMGARWHGRYVGTTGDAGIFSFGMSKVLWSIGGGLVITSNPELAEKIGRIAAGLPECARLSEAAGVAKLAVLGLLIRSHHLGPMNAVWGGMLRGKKDCDDFPAMVGASSAAAVASQLLKRLDEITEIRRRNAQYLAVHLADMNDIDIPEADVQSEPVFLRFPVIVKNCDERQKILIQLRRRGINASEMYSRTSFDALRTLAAGDSYCPRAEYLSGRMLNLPTHAFVRESDLTAIVDTFRCVNGHPVGLPIARTSTS